MFSSRERSRSGPAHALPSVWFCCTSGRWNGQDSAFPNLLTAPQPVACWGYVSQQCGSLTTMWLHRCHCCRLSPQSNNTQTHSHSVVAPCTRLPASHAQNTGLTGDTGHRDTQIQGHTDTQTHKYRDTQTQGQTHGHTYMGTWEHRDTGHCPLQGPGSCH